MRNFDKHFDGIIQSVAEVYEIPADQILSKSRLGRVAEARRAAVAATHRIYSRSLKSQKGCYRAVAGMFGMRSRWSIPFLIKSLSKDVQTDRMAKERWVKLRSQLNV